MVPSLSSSSPPSICKVHLIIRVESQFGGHPLVLSLFSPSQVVQDTWQLASLSLNHQTASVMDGLRVMIVCMAILGLLFSVLRQFLSWGKNDGDGFQKLPGPQQFPVVGRVHDLDRMCMWKKFKEWADIYGPIYRTSMLGQQFIIISDEKIAEELLIKRGNNYAGRPQIRALFDHKTGPGYLALMDRQGTLRMENLGTPIHSLILDSVRILERTAKMGARRHGRLSSPPFLWGDRVGSEKILGHTTA